MRDGERRIGHFGYKVSLGWEMERDLVVTLAMR